MRTDETGGGILGVGGDDQDKDSVMDRDHLSEDGGEDDLSGDDRDEGFVTEYLSEDGGEGDLTASVRSSFSSTFSSSSSSTYSFSRTDSCSRTPPRHIGRDVEQIPSTRHFHYIFRESYKEHVQPTAAAARATKIKKNIYIGQGTLAARMSILEDFKQICGKEGAKDLDVLMRVQKQMSALLLDINHEGIDDYMSLDLDRVERLNYLMQMKLRGLERFYYEIGDLVDELYYDALRQCIERARRVETREMIQSNTDKMKRLLVSVEGITGAKITKGVTPREMIQSYTDMYRAVFIEFTTSYEFGRMDLSFLYKSTSQVNESDVFGWKDEVEQIVQILLSLDSASGCHQPDEYSLSSLSSKSSSSSSSFAADDNTLQVLPIVGFPGIGKTTLAQLVYNDDRVKQHFGILMWVCVTNIHDGSSLTRKIINECGSASNDGKRFLLVLDDLCNRDLLRYWRTSLVSNLLGEQRRGGSVVIVTTRYESVAKVIGTLNPVRLQGLDYDDSNQMLRKYTSVRPHIYNDRLINICRKAVQKSGGVPLAIQFLGNIKSESLQEREELSEHNIWETVSKEGYHFNKLKLIKLWMAQDFIQPQGLTDRLEDEGSSYFDELLDRCFFQKVDNHYLMHTLYYYLAQPVQRRGHPKNLMITDNTSFWNFNQIDVLHLSVWSPEVKVTHIMEKVSRPSHNTILRSFIFNGEFSTAADYNTYPLELPNSFFKVFKCLRVLDLSETGLVVLPNSVGSLIHLRFLDVSQTRIEVLPNSLCRLYNLQCLELKNCNRLKELPRKLQNLISLRHLNASDDLVNTLPGIGKLNSLQELKLFNVSKKEGHTIQELENLNEIRDKLWIQNMQNVATKEEAIKANLQNKKYLNELVLEWSVNYTSSEINEAESTKLESLQPPSNLRILSIIGNSSSQAPRWMNNLLE